MPKARFKMPLLETIQYLGDENINEVIYFFEKVRDSKKMIHDPDTGRRWVICQYCQWGNSIQMLLQKRDYIVRDVNGLYKVYTEQAFLKTYEEVSE